MSSRMVFRISVLILAIATTASAQSESPPELDTASALDAASRLFGLKGKGCSGCHTIGQGDKTGPDLKGVVQRREKAWAKRFVNAPREVFDSGDPTAKELFQKFPITVMADQALTDDEFENIWAYLTHCDGLSEACIPDKWGVDASQEEIARGKAIFTGSEPLQQGGPACFGCHNVRGISIWGGGSLGTDLTFAYAQLGENDLASALEEMSTPVMKALYGKAPLTPDEQYQLKAYLANVARDGTKPESTTTGFLYLGLEGMGIVLALMLVLWNRKRGNS